MAGMAIASSHVMTAGYFGCVSSELGYYEITMSMSRVG